MEVAGKTNYLRIRMNSKWCFMLLINSTCVTGKGGETIKALQVCFGFINTAKANSVCILPVGITFTITVC